jgi:hypothetical protein
MHRLLAGLVGAALFAPGLARAEESAAVVATDPPAAATPAPAPAQDPGPVPPEVNLPTEALPKKKDDRPEWETAPATRRGGFAVGLNLGLGLGAANGFPNDSKKIGRAEYYTESGIGFATGSSLWLGGALSDWLTFGVGAGYSMILSGDTESRSGMLLFHTDVYPLYALGGPLQDVGAMFQAGFGFPTTIDTKTEETLIDGAGSSYLFLGGFWDGIKAWQFHMGPYAGVHYMWSDSVRRPLAIVGFRTTLFTAP